MSLLPGTGIAEVYDPPTAAGDSFTVAEDSGATALDVLNNDTSDPDLGGAPRITAVTQPANGTVIIDITGGHVSFQPSADFSGLTTFTYTISDLYGATATASVTVTVTPVNDPPTAVDDEFTVAEDSVSTLLNILANDSCAPDSGEMLHLVSVTYNPQYGEPTVNWMAGTINYTPAANFNGTATIRYVIMDNNDGLSEATITIHVTPVNDPPTTADDEFTVAEDSGLTVLDVLANDTCAPDSDETLRITSVTTYPPYDAVDITASADDIRFSPSANFNGTYTFNYSINDGNGGEAYGTVTVHVTPVNDPPNAADDSFTVNEDSGLAVLNLLANDSCAPDTGEALAVTALTQPTNGTVTLASGVVSFAPAPNYNGTDTFTYTLGDGNGGTDTASVHITVNPVNDPPSAADDTFAAIEDSGAAVLNVLANDTCAPDTGETLAVTAVTQPTNGTVTLVSGVVSFAPAPNYNGTDTFTYTLSDGNGGTDTAAVLVTVDPVNDPPTLQQGIPAAASASVKVKGTYKLNLAAIFGDIDGDLLSFTVAENAKSPVAAGANYAYTPAAAGVKTLVFRANDGLADSVDTYTLTLAVTAIVDSTVSVLLADVATDQSSATLPVTVDAASGDARVDLANLAQGDSGQLVVTFPAIPQTDLYAVDMPVSVLSALSQTGPLTIQTGLGSITLPPEMLTDMLGQCISSAEITIGTGDKSTLNQAVLDAIGDRPLLEIVLTIDGSPVQWDNAQTPFTVSIPYVPTAEELANPAQIAVWYVDDRGGSSPVPGVQYDAQTGYLTFSITHTGIFTVGRP